MLSEVIKQKQAGGTRQKFFQSPESGKCKKDQ